MSIVFRCSTCQKEHKDFASMSDCCSEYTCSICGVTYDTVEDAIDCERDCTSHVDD